MARTEGVSLCRPVTFIILFYPLLREICERQARVAFLGSIVFLGGLESLVSRVYFTLPVLWGFCSHPLNGGTPSFKEQPRSWWLQHLLNIKCLLLCLRFTTQCFLFLSYSQLSSVHIRWYFLLMVYLLLNIRFSYGIPSSKFLVLHGRLYVFLLG